MRTAVREVRADELAKLLQLPEVEVNQPDAQGQTALIEAITRPSKHRYAMVECLLGAADIDLYQLSYNGLMPVRTTLSVGAFEVLKRLLDDPRFELSGDIRVGLEEDLIRQFGDKEKI